MTHGLFRRISTYALAIGLLTACGDDGGEGATDTGSDVGPSDAGSADAGDGSPDAGGGTDAIGQDAGENVDSGAPDSGGDAGADTADPDAIAVAAGTCDDPIFAEAAGEVWIAEGTTVDGADWHSGSCTEDPGPDQIVVWTAPATGFAFAELVAADPVLYVRSRCDDPGSELACNDDRDDDSLDSQVAFAVTEGETYYFVADAYDFEEESAFELTISMQDAPPVTIEPGVYVSEAYGFVLETDGQNFALYELGSTYCLRALEGPAFLLETFFDQIDIDEEALTVVVSGSIGQTRAERTDALPALCASPVPVDGDEGYAFDPLQHLEIVIDAMNTHYAFFELRGFDWQGAVDTARARVSADTTPTQFAEIVQSLLGVTEDGHVTFGAVLRDGTEIDFEAGPMDVFLQLMDEFAEQDEVPDLETYIDRELGRYILGIEAQLGDAGGDVEDMRWGRNGDVGYIRLLHFGYEDAEAAGDLFDEALADLEGVGALVIDARINFGGSDDQSLAIASRFAEEETPAIAKAPRLGEGWGLETEVSTPACDEVCVLDVPVVLLVSSSTVSAGEIFTIAMRELPHVTVAGQATAGELSDIFERTLPNGWTFGLSNERYLTPAGELFENIGVPVDEAWEGEMFPLSAREEGDDAFLAAVFAELQAD